MTLSRGEPKRPCASLREVFTERQLVGRGARGDVWVCQDKRDMREYACKVMDKEEMDAMGRRENLDREINILAKVAGLHDHVIHLSSVFETATSAHLLMELCKGGDLFDAILEHGPMPEPSARVLFRQMASAVHFCHSSGIIHRDIKPDNILFVSSPDSLWNVGGDASLSSAPLAQAKLSDFGLAVDIRTEKHIQGFVGTRHYAAPEMALGQIYDHRADIWSLGVILYLVLTGSLPVMNQSGSYDDPFWRGVLRGKVDFDGLPWVSLSASAKHLIRRMLCSDPRRRLHSGDVLSHPWLLGSQMDTPPDELEGELSELDVADGAEGSSKLHTPRTQGLLELSKHWLSMLALQTDLDSGEDEGYIF